MKQGTASGYEVNLYRKEFEDLAHKVMAAHTARNGCDWDGDMDALLCDIAEAFERREICKAAA